MIRTIWSKTGMPPWVAGVTAWEVAVAPRLGRVVANTGVRVAAWGVTELEARFDPLCARVSRLPAGVQAARSKARVARKAIFFIVVYFGSSFSLPVQ
jgi:hypothetical protein